MTRVERRGFIVGTLSLLAAPLAAEAQPAGRIHRIGVLGTSDGPGWQAFRDGLQSLGYLEGRTIAVDSWSCRPTSLERPANSMLSAIFS